MKRLSKINFDASTYWIRLGPACEGWNGVRLGMRNGLEGCKIIPMAFDVRRGIGSFGISSYLFFLTPLSLLSNYFLPFLIRTSSKIARTSLILGKGLGRDIRKTRRLER